MTWRGEDEPGRITHWRPVGWEIGMTRHGMLTYGLWCEAEARATGRCVRRKVIGDTENCALFESDETT